MAEVNLVLKDKGNGVSVEASVSGEEHDEWTSSALVYAMTFVDMMKDGTIEKQAEQFLNKVLGNQNGDSNTTA